jgi:hypothetical protein
MRTLINAAVILLVASTAGLAQPKPAVAPCSLLTIADIKEAAGSDATGGIVNKLNATVCDYKVGAGGVLGVSVPPGAGASPDTIIAALNKQNIKTENAAGVGDRAFFAAMGYGMIQLNAFKGGRYVIVTLMLPGSDEAKTKGVAVKLMTKALAKF